MIAPLHSALESALRHVAARDRIVALPTPNAPTTFSGIINGIIDVDCPRRTIVPVWDGASADTVWSGADVNYLFRAWHDTHHARYGFALDYAGEREAARFALAELRPTLRLLGAAADGAAILMGEVFGQVEHYYRHGTFPARQRAFVAACAAVGIDRAARIVW